MNLIIHSKSIQTTDALKSYLEQKIGSSIEHYFNDLKNTPIYINLSTTKSNFCIEVTMPLGGVTIRAEEKTDDMYKSIDLVQEKLKRQIRKYKTRVNRKLRKERVSVPIEHIEDPVDEKKEEIVRNKQLHLHPMSAEQAIFQMNLLDHNFFVFQDTGTDRISVVYKRQDEQYGLITLDAI